MLYDSRAVSYQDHVYSPISNSGGPSCARKLLRHTSSRPIYTYIRMRIYVSCQMEKTNIPWSLNHGCPRWLSLVLRRKRARKKESRVQILYKRSRKHGGWRICATNWTEEQTIQLEYTSNFHPLISRWRSNEVPHIF